MSLSRARELLYEAEDNSSELFDIFLKARLEKDDVLADYIKSHYEPRENIELQMIDFLNLWCDVKNDKIMSEAYGVFNLKVVNHIIFTSFDENDIELDIAYIFGHIHLKVYIIKSTGFILKGSRIEINNSPWINAFKQYNLRFT